MVSCHLVLRGETSWPSNGHGTTGSGNRLESELSCRFPDPVVCALAEHRSRLISSSFNRWEGHTPFPQMKKKRGRTDALRARRPVRRQAATNARVRRRLASHRRQAIPDRLSFCRQEAGSPLRISNQLFASLRLCVGGGAGGSAFSWVGGGICVYLCDLWALRMAGCICVYLRYLRFDRAGGWARRLGVLVVQQNCKETLACTGESSTSSGIDAFDDFREAAVDDAALDLESRC
jgi:hypothetical protein